MQTLILSGCVCLCIVLRTSLKGEAMPADSLAKKARKELYVEAGNCSTHSLLPSNLATVHVNDRHDSLRKLWQPIPVLQGPRDTKTYEDALGAGLESLLKLLKPACKANKIKSRLPTTAQALGTFFLLQGPQDSCLDEPALPAACTASWQTG